jgi:hypothetical protein
LGEDDWAKDPSFQSQDYLKGRTMAAIRVYFNQFRSHEVFRILQLDVIESVLLQAALTQVESISIAPERAKHKGASGYYVPSYDFHERKAAGGSKGGELVLGKAPESDAATVIHEVNHAAMDMKYGSGVMVVIPWPSEAHAESVRGMTDVLYAMAYHLIEFEKAIGSKERDYGAKLLRGGQTKDEEGNVLTVRSIAEARRSAIVTEFSASKGTYKGMSVLLGWHAFRTTFDLDWGKVSSSDRIRSRYEQLGKEWKDSASGEVLLREPWASMPRYGDSDR